MSKKHKIVVTRDRDGGIDFWGIKDDLHKNKEGIWSSFKNGYSSLGHISIGCAESVKLPLGFLPRKGSKQVITITKAKK